MTEYDEQFITLDEAERLAVATGQWRGTDVEFSDDGEVWREHWLPTDEREHPALARATVRRKVGGVIGGFDVVETRVVVSWAEYYPGEGESTAAFWDRGPTIMLRKVAVVAALRTAFRDVIGNRHELAELHQADTPAEARDWIADLEQTTTAGQVNALHAEAKRARAVTVDLERAFRARLRAIDALDSMAGEAVLTVERLERAAQVEGDTVSIPRAPKPTPPKVDPAPQTAIAAAFADAKAGQK